MDDLKDKKDQKSTQIGMHTISNILLKKGRKGKTFDNCYKEFCKQHGIEVNTAVQGFGIKLTDIQARIMEGVLYGFSETNYEGNLSPKNKFQVAEERFSGKVPDTYKYVNKIPIIKVTQSEILKWAGVKTNQIASISRAVKALQYLGTMQYCFYYDRLAKNSKGKPIKDRDGEWEKESVIAVDTLFTIKQVRNKKTKVLEHYEIEPSSIFLDQRESYFLLIPFNWREEVHAIVGGKKASSYTFHFLLFLRYQYEIRRRKSNCIAPYQIKWAPEEIATAIRMPSSVYRRKKDRMNKILEDAYSVAKTLGYLSSYQRQNNLDILMLNDEKYYFGNSKPASEDSTITLGKVQNHFEKEKRLFNLFHKQRILIDPNHKKPEGRERLLELLEFSTLLKMRSAVEIERVICWGVSKKYWCVKLFSPKKFRENFNEAIAEMVASEKQKNTPEDNKHKANLLKKKKLKSESEIRFLSDCIEFAVPGACYPDVLPYKAKYFDKELEHLLLKHQVIVSELSVD